MITVEKSEFLGVETYKISNGTVGLTVATGVGPRIISFGFINKENVLFVNDFDFLNRSCGYKFYGGHRLWHAPEDEERTYQPDNAPCEVEVLPLGIKVSNIEKENKIQKTMQIEMKENGRVRIVHTVKNLGNFEISLAAWGITQLKKGGTAIIPMDNRKTGLLPNRSISLWDYSDLSDKRLSFTKNHIILKHDEKNEKAFKIGNFNRDGYLSYFIDGDLFVKEFDVSEGEFADFGCNSEVYLNGDFVELESLSPLTELNSGEEITHQEVWQLFDHVPYPQEEKEMTAEMKEFIHA